MPDRPNPSPTPGSASPTPDPFDTEVSMRIGPYRVLDEIGHGGMGVVYLAEQVHPVRRRVALKLIRAGMDTRDVIARFDAERQALALMHHRNIATVYDAGTSDDGRPYFAMEYVNGSNLIDYCDQERLAIPERLRLFVAVCQAIHHAHQNGVIHRDVSPGNILVATEDGGPVPKIIDFGIAKSLAHPLTDLTIYTQRHLVIGKPAYMPPEQLGMGGGHLDVTADIYALGMVLYELLVGALPLDLGDMRGLGAEMAIARLLNEEPPRPSTRVVELGERADRPAVKRQLARGPLAAALRGELDWIVMRAIERERGRRYPAASELAADIERHLEGEPVLARPPSTAYRLRKLIRKHRVTFAAVLGVFLALAVGLGIATRMYLRAERERQRAEWQTYLASIRAASASLREGETREARRWLAACAPVLRGWEWDHLMHRTDASIHAIQVPERRVVWAGFAPDGRSFAATSTAGRVRVWSWGDSVPRLRELYAPAGGALCLARYSPDGRRLAIGAIDSTVVVWDLAAGSQSPPRRGAFVKVLSLAWSEDGRSIAVTSDLPSVSILDAADGNERRVIPLPGVGAAAVIYGPRGDHLLVGRQDGVIQEFDARSGVARGSFRGHDGSIVSMTFSPDGRRLVSVSVDQTVRVWDARNRATLRVLREHKGNVNGVAYRADGRYFATASYDKTIRVWDAETFACVRVLYGHEAYIYPVDYSPDGRFLISGGDDETIRIWRPDRPDNPLVLPCDTSVTSVVALAGGAVLAGDAGGRLYRWRDGEARPERVLRAHAGPITQIVADGPRRLVASTATDGVVQVWNAALGRLGRWADDQSAAYSIALSPDGGRAALGMFDGSVRLWDLQEDRTRRILTHRDLVQGVAFSPDGKRLATASWGSGLILWGQEMGDSTRWPFPNDGPMRLAFTPDSRRLIGGTWYGKVRVWDAARCSLSQELSGHNSVVPAVAVSPDGRRIASVSQDRTLRLWDARSGELLVTLEGHTAGINAVSFSPDGNTIVTASDDRTVRVWRR